MLLSLSLLAEVKNEYISKEFLKQNIPMLILEHRENGEKLGLLKGAIHYV